MQKILAIARKEFLIWARKPGSWMVIFLVPFIFIWIIQMVFGSSGTPVVTIYAVNEDAGREAARVMSALRDAPNLKIEVLKTREEADHRVGTGERMAAVVVPEGYSQALTTNNGAKVEIIIDPARAEQANIVVGLVNSAIAPLMVDAEVSRGVETGIARVLGGAPTPGPTPAPGESAAQPAPTQPAVQPTASSSDALRKFFTAAMKGVVSSQVQETLDNPLVGLDVQPNQSGGPVHKPSLLDYLVPGYSLMFVFFLIPNLALTVIEERQRGTLRRLMVSPVARSQILLGKMLPFFLIAVVQFTTVLLVSKLLFGIDLGRSALALGIVILAASLAMAALGILIAGFARTEGQADGLTIVIVLAMAVVSGAMFPSIAIPGLQSITPHYWAMQGFLNVIARGQGVQGVLFPAGILLTMSAVFFIVGAVRFRFE